MCMDGSENKLIKTCKRCGRDGIMSLRHHGLGWCRSCEDHIDIMELLNRLLIVYSKLIPDDEDVF